MAKKTKRKIDFKYNFGIYFNLIKKYKFLLLGTFFLILIIESTNVVDKFLFKLIIDRGTEFVAGTLLKAIFVKLLIVLAIIFLTLVMLKAVAKWIHMHLLNKIETDLIIDLKRKFFNHIISLSYNFYTTHKTGSLISRLVRGGRAIEGMTDTIVFNFAPLVFQLIVASLSLLYFDWIPALIVFLTVLVFILYSLFIQIIQQEPNVLANDAEDLEKARIGDIFTNIDSVKYFGKEHYIKNRFLSLIRKTSTFFLRHWNYFRWFDSVQSLILGVGTLLLIYFPLVQFLNKEISIGTIVFIYTVYGNLIGPMFGFVYGLRDFYRTMADFEALFEYAKIENDIKDIPNAKELKIEKGEINFNDIIFNYGTRRLFTKFNLKIPKNKKVALVGHSGCGKTTLVKLLYRLYDVDKGSILIDNKDIRKFKQESLRSEMSVVPQECMLFDDTIYNNIAFSKPSATKKEVMKAMKFAQLDKFVAQLPKKENTIVGERGIRLSGGEKQRVSIARAILADKKVLVLDEATSSLDSKTEHEIQLDLKKLMKGRTSIIIAHRLSTIMNADIIVVMEKGKIVQIGKHKKLIKQRGHYKELWNLQKGGYIR